MKSKGPKEVVFWTAVSAVMTAFGILGLLKGRFNLDIPVGILILFAITRK